MSMKNLRLAALPLLLSGALLSCAEEGDPNAALYVPSQKTFPAVSDALERRCATLDCHGKPERNLRLYGRSGMRLAPTDVPGDGATTDAEYEANYSSVIGLEPELLSAVVASGGQTPERLSLVRKARGAEAHKGGARLTPKDNADQCLTTWLASATNLDACTRATNLGPPW